MTYRNDDTKLQHYMGYRTSIIYGLNTVTLERHSADPEGKRKRIIPISQISSVERKTNISFQSFVVGFLLFLWSNYLIVQQHFKSFAFCFLVGIIMMTHCVSTLLTIAMTSGEDIVIEFTGKQRAEAKEIEEKIQTMIEDSYEEE